MDLDDDRAEKAQIMGGPVHRMLDPGSRRIAYQLAPGVRTLAEPVKALRPDHPNIAGLDREDHVVIDLERVEGVLEAPVVVGRDGQ